MKIDITKKRSATLLGFTGYDSWYNSYPTDQLESKWKVFANNFDQLISKLEYKLYNEVQEDNSLKLIEIHKISEIPNIGDLGSIGIYLYNTGDIHIYSINPHKVIKYISIENYPVRMITYMLRHGGVTDIKFKTKKDLINKIIKLKDEGNS